MRILAFSDPHCTRSSEFSKPTEDGYNEYLQSCIKSFKFIENLTHELKPDTLAFCGDFWDARDYVDTISLNVGFKIWESLSNLPIAYKLAVVGNHDYFSIDHNIHNLEILKSLGWFVFDEPDLINVASVRILGLPYRDRYDAEQLMAWNEAGEPEVVLAHCDVIGGRRRAPKSDRDTKAFSPTGLPASIFSKAGVVLNGHYHHPSEVTSNWYNIGSLTSRTFHDKDSNPRGAVLYDTETRELIRCPNPHAKEFIDITIEQEEDLTDILSEDYTNTYARIYYDLELEDEAQTVREMFAGARLLPIAKKRAKTDATTIDLRFSLEENLQRFVDERYGDQGLTRMALEIFGLAAKEHTASSSREPLEFGWVELRNFQSIGYFKFDLRSKGVLFLRGINNDDPGQDGNGSGKSSFVEGIYWCLTGKSLRGYKGNEVIHWDEDYTRVSLEIYVGDQVYTVIRSRKDSSYGTGVRLFRGTEIAGARLPTDTEVKLEELIGRSEDSLKHVCFMTTGMANRFTRLTYPQRARLLEDIIDSKPYYLCEKIAEQRLKDAQLDLSRVRGSLETMLEIKEATEERIAELKTELAQFDEIHSNARTSAETQKELLEQQIADEEQNMKDAEADAKLLEEKIESFRAKRLNFENEAMVVYTKRAELQAEVAVLAADINRLGSLKNQEVCPTCEQPVDYFSTQTLFNSKKIEKDGIDLVIWEVSGDYDRLKSRMRTLDAAISARKQAHHNKVQASVRSGTYIKMYRSQLSEVSEKLNDIEMSREKYNSQLVEREKELERLHPQLTELMDEEERLEANENTLKILAQDVFNEKGVRNSILSQVALPYLNSRIPIYAQYLWGGRIIELAGSRDLKGGRTKNDIDISLGSNHTYKGNSAGEKRRVDLIIQLALNDLAAATGRSRVGFLVIDEAFDTLDESGIYAAVESLRQKAAGTILIVSHRKYAASICPQQITFVKESRYTRLLEDYSGRN